MPADVQYDPVGHAASLAHDAGQLVLVPSQTTLPAHTGEPAFPALLAPHVPLPAPLCFSAAAHASHAPAHAVSQQYPSAQLPFAHWLPAVHAAPCASFATHDVPLQ